MNKNRGGQKVVSFDVCRSRMDVWSDISVAASNAGLKRDAFLNRIGEGKVLYKDGVFYSWATVHKSTRGGKREKSMF